MQICEELSSASPLGEAFEGARGCAPGGRRLHAEGEERKAGRRTKERREGTGRGEEEERVGRVKCGGGTGRLTRRGMKRREDREEG